MLQQARAVHFGSLSLTDEPSRNAAAEARRRIAGLATQANLLKVNEVECSLLTGGANPDTASRRLLALGPDLCVITLGTRGS